MADPWTDVVTHPQGGFIRAVSIPHGVRVEWNGQLLWERSDVPIDFLRQIRAAVSPAGAVQVVGIGHDDNVYGVMAEGWSVQGKSSGQNNCAITHDGSQFVIYIQTGPRSYTKNGVEHPMEHSSQGFQDVFPDGRVVFGADTVNIKLFNGQRLQRYTERGDFVVGDANDAIGVFRKSDGKFFIVRRGWHEGIHAAVSNDRLAIVALTAQGAFFQEFPPFPQDVTPTSPVIEEPKQELPKAEPVVVTCGCEDKFPALERKFTEVEKRLASVLHFVQAPVPAPVVNVTVPEELTQLVKALSQDIDAIQDQLDRGFNGRVSHKFLGSTSVDLTPKK